EQACDTREHDERDRERRRILRPELLRDLLHRALAVRAALRSAAALRPAAALADRGRSAAVLLRREARGERGPDVVARAGVRLDVLGQVLERLLVTPDGIDVVDPAVVPIVDEGLPAWRGGGRRAGRHKKEHARGRAQKKEGSEDRRHPGRRSLRNARGGIGSKHWSSLGNSREGRLILLLSLCNGGWRPRAVLASAVDARPGGAPPVRRRRLAGRRALLRGRFLRRPALLDRRRRLR